MHFGFFFKRKNTVRNTVAEFLALKWKNKQLYLYIFDKAMDHTIAFTWTCHCQSRHALCYRMQCLKIEMMCLALNENKSCVIIDESWQAIVCMRVVLTRMSWSNENKSCIRINQGWQTRVCMRVFWTLMMCRQMKTRVANKNWCELTSNGLYESILSYSG